MATDIGGFGLKVTVTASITFPQGITITQFADDADAMDNPAVQIRDKGMGLNGDLVTWGKANAIGLVINVIPNSTDDENLQLIAVNNRSAKGRQPVNDVISAVVQYPDGSSRSLSGGSITDAVLLNSITSAARMKSKPYTFAFENED